ncbi:diacylglycerol kinase [Pseudohongiella spirulinae]|uniref:diacylglycerol kinase n=1 Tax=Pseudohongiella spirulinae TaxID=1249552 RepID=UPI0012E3CB8D|nr:diacylglycerol kinase [Pseudohongiella spirulinae]
MRRLINATGYSARGIRSLWSNEAAFRQETALSVVLLPVVVLADISGNQKRGHEAPFLLDDD